MSKKHKSVYKNRDFQVAGGAEEIVLDWDPWCIKNARWVAHYYADQGDYYNSAGARVLADSYACIQANECYVDQGKLYKKKKNGKAYNHEKAVEYCYKKDGCYR